MPTRAFALFTLLAAMGTSAYGESIEGSIVIKRRLTKPRVTASVPLYQRGPSVELGADPETDPLALERSRVAVYLEGRFPQGPGAAPGANAAIARMEQTNRRFSPEMLVIEAGSKVSFPNLDPIFHNVFSLSSPKIFDLGNYAKGDTRLVSFPEPGIVFVNCHLHANMTAAIVVTPNRWHTKGDRDGSFVLRDVPPGKYTIAAWHKAAGYFRQQVEVLPGRNERVTFFVPLDEQGRRLEAQK